MSGVLGNKLDGERKVTEFTNVSVSYSHFVVTTLSTCYCAQIHLIMFYNELLRVVICITSLQILVSCQSHMLYMFCIFVFVCACVCVCICSSKQVSLTGFNIIKFIFLSVKERRSKYTRTWRYYPYCNRHSSVGVSVVESPQRCDVVVAIAV